MNPPPIHGYCMGQHDGDVLDPTKPLCDGDPHIGPVHIERAASLTELHAALRRSLPPNWTIVAVERLSVSGQGFVWWVYAEPDSISEPDRVARTAKRVNCEDTYPERAYARLIEHVRTPRLVEPL